MLCIYMCSSSGVGVSINAPNLMDLRSAVAVPLTGFLRKKMRRRKQNWIGRADVSLGVRKLPPTAQTARRSDRQQQRGHLEVTSDGTQGAQKRSVMAPRAGGSDHRGQRGRAGATTASMAGTRKRNHASGARGNTENTEEVTDYPQSDSAEAETRRKLRDRYEKHRSYRVRQRRLFNQATRGTNTCGTCYGRTLDSSSPHERKRRFEQRHSVFGNRDQRYRGDGNTQTAQKEARKTQKGGLPSVRGCRGARCKHLD